MQHELRNHFDRSLTIGEKGQLVLSRQYPLDFEWRDGRIGDLFYRPRKWLTEVKTEFRWDTGNVYMEQETEDWNLDYSYLGGTTTAMINGCELYIIQFLNNKQDFVPIPGLQMWFRTRIIHNFMRINWKQFQRARAFDANPHGITWGRLVPLEIIQELAFKIV